MAKSSKDRWAKCGHRKVATGAERRRMLRTAAWTINGDFSANDGVRIVQILQGHFHMTMPRWKDLTASEHLLFYQLAGHLAGINEALTFDISDEQLENWLRDHGSLAEGFRKEILQGCRYLFDGPPEYWFVIEPKISKGKDKHSYADQPGQPRRFDVHCGIKIEWGRQSSRFQKYIWKRTEKIGAGTSAFFHEPFPLRRRGRMSYMRRIKDEFWGPYASKCVEVTKAKHADLASVNPYGASAKIKGVAQELYQQFRSAIRTTAPASNDVMARFQAEAGTTRIAEEVYRGASLAVTCGSPSPAA